MDKYENIKSYKETDFRIVTGVIPDTFTACVKSKNSTARQ